MIKFKLTINFTNLTGFAILLWSCYNDFNNAGLVAGVSLMGYRKYIGREKNETQN